MDQEKHGAGQKPRNGTRLIGSLSLSVHRLHHHELHLSRLEHGLVSRGGWGITLANLAVKVCLAVRDTPLIYLSVYFLKKYLRLENKLS